MGDWLYLNFLNFKSVINHINYSRYVKLVLSDMKCTYIVLTISCRIMFSKGSI